METYRVRAIFGALFVIAAMGGMAGWWLINNCPALLEANCRFLWGVAFISILGGIFLLEIHFSNKKARGEWRRSNENGLPEFSTSQIWLMSIAKITLASLLVVLPFILQGTFAIVFSGALVGVGISGLIRAIFDNLPPIKK